jgi:hypothetical protein
LVLAQLIPFVTLAVEKECLVKRSGDIELHARNCKKQGQVFQVQSCDTNWICKAKRQNVKTQAGACKDSTSAPKFMDAYQSGNKAEIVGYLKAQQSVLKIQVGSEPNNKSILSSLAKAAPDQRIALFDFSSKQKSAQATIEDDPEILNTLASGKIEYVYSVDDQNSQNLKAYAVRGKKLVNVQVEQAVPSCGD